MPLLRLCTPRLMAKPAIPTPASNGVMSISKVPKSINTAEPSSKTTKIH